MKNEIRSMDKIQSIKNAKLDEEEILKDLINEDTKEKNLMAIEEDK